MTENQTAPKPPVLQENQAQTVAGPSVYPGAEPVGMTDEERARGIAYNLYGEGPGYEAALALASQWIVAIRADERERCAKIADAGQIEMPRNQASIEAAGAYVLNTTCHRIATAIRARGSQ